MHQVSKLSGSWGGSSVFCRALASELRLGKVAVGASPAFQEGQDGLQVFLQGLVETYPGQEAPGVVELQPGNLALGSGALFEDGDQSAVQVEQAAFLILLSFSFFRIVRGCLWDRTGTDWRWAPSWPGFWRLCQSL